VKRLYSLQLSRPGGANFWASIEAQDANRAAQQLLDKHGVESWEGVLKVRVETTGEILTVLRVKGVCSTQLVPVPLT
jgi:hypothetical protein